MNKARQEKSLRERREGTHVHTHKQRTYLGVVADEGRAVARVHGTRAEVALDNPHGCLLVPVLLWCREVLREVSVSVG